MLSYTESNQAENNTLFETICRLAKNQDKGALKKMVKEGVSLNSWRGKYTPVTLLAREREVDAVNFLIKEFRGNHEDAVQGYAMGKHIDQMNQWIAQGVSIDSAMMGYAMGKHVDQVNQLIAQGVSLDHAAFGYAMGGHHDQVNQLIAQNVGSRDLAVQAYALAGDVDQVNQLIKEGASRNVAVMGYALGGHVDQVNQLVARRAGRDAAMTGYALGGHLNRGNILRLMTFTDDLTLRTLLGRETQKKNSSLDVSTLQKQAAKLREIMEEWQPKLNFKQAQSLIVKGTKEWLLQGPQLVRNSIFPAEVFFNISSFVLGLSDADTAKVFEMVHDKIFSRCLDKLSTDYKSAGFFKRAEYFEKHRQAEEQCEKRLTF